MKQQQIYKGIIGHQGWGADEFEHQYGRWSEVRNNWAKAKRRDKRLAKHRMNQIRNEQIKEELNDYGNDRSAQ